MPITRNSMHTVAGLLLLLLCTAFPAFAASSEIKIFVTNDVHGHIATDAQTREIGFPLLKAYINAATAKGYTSYLFDAGDAFSGGAYTHSDNGLRVARLMREMGYRGMVPGNHAFDYNMVTNDPLYFSNVILPAAKGSKPDLFTATAVNFAYKGKAAPNVQQEPLIIHDETKKNPNGLRIIVTGVITPEAGKNAARKLLTDYDFGATGAKASSAETKNTILRMLRNALAPYSRKNDIVIVLAHVGYSQDMPAEMLSGKDLASVTNVAIVVDGHTHKAIQPEKITKAWYVNGGRYLVNFTELTIKLTKTAIPVIAVSLRDYDDVKSLTPEKNISASIDTLTQQWGFAQKVLTIPGDNPKIFSASGIRQSNKPLGCIITTAMLGITGADLAIYNSGGFRTGLPPGEVTTKHIYDVMPFSNTLVTIEMTGGEIAAMFKKNLKPGSGNFPQFSGMSVHAMAGTSAYKVASVRDAKGVLLDPQRTYIVALNSHMLANNYTGRAHPILRNYGDTAAAIVKQLSQQTQVDWKKLLSPNLLMQ